MILIVDRDINWARCIQNILAETNPGLKDITISTGASPWEELEKDIELIILGAPAECWHSGNSQDEVCEVSADWLESFRLGAKWRVQIEKNEVLGTKQKNYTRNIEGKTKRQLPILYIEKRKTVQPVHFPYPWENKPLQHKKYWKTMGANSVLKEPFLDEQFGVAFNEAWNFKFANVTHNPSHQPHPDIVNNEDDG